MTEDTIIIFTFTKREQNQTLQRYPQVYNHKIYWR